MAPARSMAVAISSRYDTLSSHQRFGRCAERRVGLGIAWDGADQMAIEMADQIGEGCAPRFGQLGFPHVFRGCFGSMKTDGLAPIELQDQREKPMAQSFGIAARTGQPLRHCKMARRIH